VAGILLNMILRSENSDLWEELPLLEVTFVIVNFCCRGAERVTNVGKYDVEVENVEGGMGRKFLF
jgi:hypothetical protein